MGKRPFIDTLRETEYGHLLDELSDVQANVVDAAIETGKKGQIIITLNYIPEGNGQITIEADLKHKAPQPPRGKTLFFVTPERNLTRHDPRQQQLEGLRSVNEDNKPVREINHG